MLKRLFYQNVNISHQRCKLTSKLSLIHFGNCLKRRIITTRSFQDVQHNGSNQKQENILDGSNNDNQDNNNIEIQVPKDIRSKDMNYWTRQETDMLKDAVSKHGNKWTYISKEYFRSNRKPDILCQKWKTIKLSESRPSYYNRWTTEECNLLIIGVEKYGAGNW